MLYVSTPLDGSTGPFENNQCHGSDRVNLIQYGRNKVC